MNKEMSDILGIASSDAATLAGETAAHQKEQQPAPDSFPTFDPNGGDADTLGLADNAGQQVQPDSVHVQSAPPQAPEQQGDQRPPMMVPNTRLTEEADKRRDAEAKMREMQAEQDKLATRVAMMNEAFMEGQKLQLEQTQQQQAPDPSEDIEAYVKWKEQEWAKESQGLRQELDQMRGVQEQRQTIEGINARANADKYAFEKQAPDFNQAYSWWRNSQMAELDALGVTPAQATQHLDAMELQLSHAAQQRNTNSAEAFYKAALARGWRTPQQQAAGDVQTAAQQQTVTPIAQHPQYQPQAQPQPAPIQGQYQQPAPTGYQQQAPQAQSLANMQQGMQQSRSLDQAPPGASAVPLDLQTMANMSDADFMAHYSTIKQKMRAVMG